MTYGKTIVLVGLLMGAAPGALGAGLDFKIDSENSAVLFKVKNRDVAFVYGRFNKVTGVINVDRRVDPTELSLEIKVSAKSLDTNSKKRDKHLKGKEFFDSRSKPNITFKSTKATKLEDNKFKVTGELEFLGIKKEITVEFQITGFKRIRGGKSRLGGQTTFTIKRSDFGMTNMLSEIADEVTIIVSLEGEFTMPPAG